MLCIIPAVITKPLPAPEMVVKKLLEKIRGTDIEKLLKEYHVIE